MSTPENTRFVRLRLELVLEVADEAAVRAAALGRIEDEAAEGGLPDDERAHAETVVTEDTAEALAYLVDPFDLVSEVPGIELAQASWSTEAIDYDPHSPEWDLGGDDGEEDFDDEEPTRAG
ncbi:hypothetical protein [Streptomyces sp. NPDC046859]|uniref:hypothetical protein n=1 Tax=Streptomyces sp. NPDC046859 TaxID=3155734 RepID=UPI0033DF33DE